MLRLHVLMSLVMHGCGHVGAYSVHNYIFAEQRYDGRPINDSRSCSVLFIPVYAYSFFHFPLFYDASIF